MGLVDSIADKLDDNQRVYAFAGFCAATEAQGIDRSSAGIGREPIALTR